MPAPTTQPSELSQEEITNIMKSTELLREPGFVLNLYKPTHLADRGHVVQLLERQLKAATEDVDYDENAPGVPDDDTSADAQANTELVKSVSAFELTTEHLEGGMPVLVVSNGGTFSVGYPLRGSSIMIGKPTSELPDEPHEGTDHTTWCRVVNCQSVKSRGFRISMARQLSICAEREYHIHQTKREFRKVFDKLALANEGKAFHAQDGFSIAHIDKDSAQNSALVQLFLDEQVKATKLSLSSSANAISVGKNTTKIDQQANLDAIPCAIWAFCPNGSSDTAAVISTLRRPRGLQNAFKASLEVAISKFLPGQDNITSLPEKSRQYSIWAYRPSDKAPDSPSRSWNDPKHSVEASIDDVAMNMMDGSKLGIPDGDECLFRTIFAPTGEEGRSMSFRVAKARWNGGEDIARWISDWAKIDENAKFNKLNASERETLGAIYREG